MRLHPNTRPFAAAAMLSMVVAVAAPSEGQASPLPVLPSAQEDQSPVVAGSGRAGIGSGSAVYVDQIGEGNTTTIAQRRSSTRSVARVVQNGEGNVATIDQDAVSAFADVAQSGDANVASIVQSGTAHGTASIAQTGVGNQAVIRQASHLIENAALARQSGNRNVIDLDQSGGGNTVILSQDGDDNRMSVAQTGSNNSLTWAQAGSGLAGPSVSMEGNDRSLTILQYNIDAPR